ncbi:MFS transporter [Caloramator sp. CAR-1]|uniref:MFS transporter n=1 Tax=Caloramator sp. CAR-1 TaxID=3062777 RepID=UPI0026E1C5A7|nr:MFS transporter [Caloramator sp. CAR-1]MDO6355238.1 MFS transporter [Caloramator sp. CAR-1]
MGLDSNKKKEALKFIFLFGLISALGDITYEGARSVYGNYLGFLGASALYIGVITGFGEFLGYAFRILSGYFVDRTGKSWAAAILGYGLLISVPLLAIAGNWKIAALFIILERLGKAIRNPGKDTMLSHATKHVGTGVGFGISEALDQLGAIIGPMIFTLALSFYGSYKIGFHLMWIPAILTVAVVLYTRYKFPSPQDLEEDFEKASKVNSKNISNDSLSKSFWHYLLFIFLSILGFANFPVLSYHLMKQKVLSEAIIPTLYALAMALDGAFAVLVGKYYDKKGLGTLILIPILSIPIVFLGFSQSSLLAIIAIALWGCVMSIHETLIKAVIADIIPIKNRGKAYGIFNTVYGVSMLLGSTIIGYLYDFSKLYIFIYVVTIEILAAIVFIIWKKNNPHDVKA